MCGLEFVRGCLFEGGALQVGDGVDLEFDMVFVGVGSLVKLPESESVEEHRP